MPIGPVPWQPALFVVRCNENGALH